MLGLRMVTAKKSTKRQAVRSSARGDHGREPVCEFGERACRGALDELLGHEDCPDLSEEYRKVTKRLS